MSATRREVVREVVAQVAPHELVLFDGFRSLDDRQVTSLLSSRGRARDPVGFGVSEVTALVTPVVWLVVDEVARRGAGLAADGLLARFRAMLRKLFRRSSGTARMVPPLTPAQLAAVHTRVVERAEAAGIDDRAAGTLADAVVSRLARGSASGSAPAPEPSGEAAG